MALEHGLVTPATPGVLNLDTPAGKVAARYRMDGDKVAAVTLTNVPSFLYLRDVEAEVSALGRLRLDIAYGGNFYPIVETQPGYRDMADFSPAQLVAMGRELREYLNRHYDIVHPLDPNIRGVRHCLWTGAPKNIGSSAANAVLYGESALDRSPCGTGTSARLAQRHARGLLAVGEDFVHESIIGVPVHRPRAGRDPGRRLPGHRALGAGLGALHRLQPHPAGRCRSLRPRLRGGLR